ncbi:MAG TPA: hypothetical protein VKE51_30580 [Vicinamibacterales bacterium]|nr:hypothetical protein [Vicinamibacterales bacterium]
MPAASSMQARQAGGGTQSQRQRALPSHDRERLLEAVFPHFADGDLEDRVADEGVGPDRADRVLLCHQLSRPAEQVFQDGECLGPQLDGLRALPETLVHEIERKRVEVDAAFV